MNKVDIFSIAVESEFNNITRSVIEVEGFIKSKYDNPPTSLDTIKHSSFILLELFKRIINHYNSTNCREFFSEEALDSCSEAFDKKLFDIDKVKKHTCLFPLDYDLTDKDKNSVLWQIKAKDRYRDKLKNTEIWEEYYG